MEKQKSYIPGSENCRLLGRTCRNGELLWLAFSGSGVEFTVTAKRAELRMIGDSTAVPQGTDENYARFAVYLDGKRILDSRMEQDEQKVPVFQGETIRTAVVRVIKLSEAAMSTLAIQQIVVDEEGGIAPTPEKEHLIEFIGDSITCGYGVEDEDENHHFSTATEDVTKAFAYKAAEKLGAACSCVCLSGYGIISGYTGDGVKIPEQILPKYYERFGFSYGRMRGLTPQELEWNFQTQTPDLIVINLGTNDASYCGENVERRAEYTEQYAAFLNTVRKRNPEAEILCTLGMMGDELFESMKAAVEQYRLETGDCRVRLHHFTPQKPEDGLAADWHPTEKTHEKAAEALAAVIRGLWGQTAGAPCSELNNTKIID